jgi:glycosyltransferase involved in cell wall biosynthesis
MSRPPEVPGRPFLSVVIPAFNEAATLGRMITDVLDVVPGDGGGSEILVVDDGSTDGTYELVLATAASDRRVGGLRFSRRFGKEAALLAGLRFARGEVVITMDADHQHPPEVIPLMIEHWRKGAKVVHGVKNPGASRPFVERARSRAVHALISRLGGIDVRDSSDFKLLDRSVVRVLTETLPERRRFYRGLATWVGFPQAFVKFDVMPRTDGTSHWSFRALADLATTALVSFTSAPLRIVSVFGVCALIFSLAVATDTLVSRFRGKAVSGFATLEITLLFMGSLIMLSLGIVGEYLAKAYDEVKARPPFIVSEACGFVSDAVPPPPSGSPAGGAERP